MIGLHLSPNHTLLHKPSCQDPMTTKYMCVCVRVCQSAQKMLVFSKVALCPPSDSLSTNLFPLVFSFTSLLISSLSLSWIKVRNDQSPNVCFMVRSRRPVTSRSMDSPIQLVYTCKHNSRLIYKPTRIPIQFTRTHLIYL